MKNAASLLSLFVLSLTFLHSPAAAQALQENPFSRLTIINGLQRSPQKQTVKPSEPSSQLKNIQVFGENSGIAYTVNSLFRTDNGGEGWRKINPPQNDSETISNAAFFSLSHEKIARLKTNEPAATNKIINQMAYKAWSEMSFCE